MNRLLQEQDLVFMNLSDGQRLALAQLKSIESESGDDIEILGYNACDQNEQYIIIDISLNTKGIHKKPAGFIFRPRERLHIYIHKTFPFELPKVSFSDFRYLGKPHVQWGKDICLYQSVESDYDPSDGMFGFVDRLLLWLKKAALGELDSLDAPLHPPVAYIMKENVPIVIPNSDTPKFDGQYWLGACVLNKLNQNCFVISEWQVQLKKNIYYGAVLLMKNSMPFEYPFTLNHLRSELIRNGVDEESFLKTLGNVSLHNKAGTPVFIIIGSPMRGYESDRKQHLAAWFLEEKYARSIRTFLGTKIKSYGAYRKVKSHAEKLDNFAKDSLLDWCKVLENRSEIILSRDDQSPINVFKNKRIEIWGCGALGSHVAEIVVRAKPKEILLYDNGIVKPGILSRQLFYEKDIGENKAVALKERLQKIYTELYPLKIEAFTENVLSRLENDSLGNNTDIIIDTTASQRVFRKADKVLTEKLINASIISLVINNDARKALAIVKPAEYNSGIFDIMRKGKLNLCSLNKSEWLSAFFPQKEDSIRLIQPEPGCSDPTFIGSEADLSALTGLVLNSIGSDFISNGEAKVYFVSQELYLKKNENFEQYSFKPCSNELILNDNVNQYKIYLSQDVINKIKEAISTSDKKHNPPHETGGLIFGEWDDLSKIVYLSDISGPPADSKSSPIYFECGTKGTKEMNSHLKKKYRNSVYFVGLWHSHPFGSTNYSEKDKVSMQLVVTELSPPKSLLLIIAYNKMDFKIAGFVFNKSQV